MNQRLLFVGCFILTFFLPMANAVSQDLAIDLTRVDFTKPGMHPISGAWQFYWNRLLLPTDFSTSPSGEMMKVPGAWNRQADYPARGFATYRMKIKLPPKTSGLVIYFPVINSAAKIWINGEMVMESGTASMDKNLYRPRLNSTIVEVPAQQTELEVIINVVNFNYFAGGFSGTPQIGKITDLMTQLSQTQGMDNFFAGSLMAMFIYQLVLFFLYNRGKSYLWLSLICLGVALRAMIVHGGPFLLPNLLPSVSWELWKKIEFGSVYGIGALFPLYIFDLFKKEAPRWPVYFFVGASVLLCVVVVFTPQYVYGQLLDVGHVILLLSFLYAIYAVASAWRNGNKDARIIFFGVLVSFPFILTEILKNTFLIFFNIQLMYLVEMGVLVFLLFQIYLLANHYANSYKNLESLNQNLEQIVVERTRQLVTANRVKDKLLSVVSHDIKSPLNSLRGILTIYNKGSIDATEFKHFSKHIEGDLSKTSLLVDDILYWTASQIKGVQVKFEQFNVRDILNENVELFRTIASNKNLTIQNEANDGCNVIFDRNILNLSVRNLISNAIKFSHEGGEIIIRSEHQEDVCLIKIIDFGIGMTEEVVRSLQDVQDTQSSEGTGREKGTGLGISFCREFLLVAGGQLEIKSEPGKGSVLTISIPNKS